MSEFAPQDSARLSSRGLSSRGVLGKPAVATLLVASVASAALLLWNGPASAATSGAAAAASSPAIHLLGLPLGAAVWLLLGVVGLVIGIAGVGRSRGVRANPPVVSGDFEPSDEAASVTA